MTTSNLLDRPAAKADSARGQTADDTKGKFLALLTADIARGPQALGRFSGALLRRMRKLTAETKIDRKNDRIEGDVGL